MVLVPHQQKSQMGTASTWRVGAQVLPQSASFKYLGLIFHESGTMSYALQRLAHNAVGACAQLRAKFRGLLCQQSFPIMRRLFDALVLPTVSYGSEVWGPSCSSSLQGISFKAAVSDNLANCH